MAGASGDRRGHRERLPVSPREERARVGGTDEGLVPGIEVELATLAIGFALQGEAILLRQVITHPGERVGAEAPLLERAGRGAESNRLAQPVGDVRQVAEGAG